MVRKIIKLNNGETIIYKRRKSNNATSMHVGFFCGHNYANNGIPHILEHMLLSQTKKRTNDQLIDDNQNITRLNAYTTNDLVVVNFFQSNKRLEQCFEFASDVLLNRNLSQKLLDSEKNIVLEEKYKYKDKLFKDLSFRHSIFTKTGIGDLDTFADRIFGTDQFILNLTVEDLENYAKQHFVADKFIMTIVTSLPYRKISKLIKKYFINHLEKTKEKSEILPHVIHPIDQKQGINFVENINTTLQTQLTIKVNCSEDEYLHDYSPSNLKFTLNNRKDLFYYMVRKAGLSYNPRVILDENYGKETMGFGIQFTTTTEENIAKIIEQFGNAIKLIKNNPITQKDIDLYVEDYIVYKDTVANNNYATNAHNLLNNFCIRGDEKPLSNKEVLKNYKKISVESIQKVVDKFFDENNEIYLTVMGNIDKSKILTIDEYKRLLFQK